MTRALAAALAALALAGCVQIRSATPDERYLGKVHDRAPSTATLADDDVIYTGHLACDNLEAGTSRAELLSIAGDSGFPVSVAAVMVDAATEVYCPDYR